MKGSSRPAPGRSSRSARRSGTARGLPVATTPSSRYGGYRAARQLRDNGDCEGAAHGVRGGGGARLPGRGGSIWRGRGSGSRSARRSSATRESSLDASPTGPSWRGWRGRAATRSRPDTSWEQLYHQLFLNEVEPRPGGAVRRFCTIIRMAAARACEAGRFHATPSASSCTWPSLLGNAFGELSRTQPRARRRLELERDERERRAAALRFR